MNNTLQMLFASPAAIYVVTVGAAEGCDLLIFGTFIDAKDQKIAAFGSSYGIVFGAISAAC
ncbi:hypothetical protein ACYZUD_12320 [Pseudomonas sp. XS1P51]